MLTDPEEIRIIANARQKNVADPNRSREHFHRIFEDFLFKVDFKNKVLLDLGPGQYDFGELARERGAIAHGIDNDPCVVRLGEYKKLPSRFGSLEELKALDYDIRFDGIFCKYSINAFWFFKDDLRIRDYVYELGKLVKADGWIWIAPWNGVHIEAKLSSTRIHQVLDAQAKAFADIGCACLNLSKDMAKRYGVHGSTANSVLFIRNLRCPKQVLENRIFF